MQTALSQTSSPLVQAPEAGSSGAFRATPQIMMLPPGTYTASIVGDPNVLYAVKGVVFPAVQLTSLPEPGLKPLQFLDTSGLTSSIWLSTRNQIAFIVTAESAPLLVTIFTVGGQLQSGVKVDIRRADAGPTPMPQISVVAHIERVGDRRFTAGEWVCAGDSPNWIEGFSLEGDAAVLAGLQYGGLSAAFPNGHWAMAPAYLGTRGQRMPLLGIGFRCSDDVRARHLLRYTARFLRQGEVEGEDGMLCRSPLPQDPLIAFKVTLQPR